MRKIWILLVVVVIVGAGIAAWRATKNSTKNDSMTQKSSQVQATSMSAMQKQFNGYKGETYDRMFLASMITHHQGAVDMAQLAVTSAKHQEIKDLADSIIAAQNTEISQMQAWQKSWGYPADTAATMHDSGSKAMTSEISTMMAALNGMTGDGFDSAFLTQMKAHHRSAIDMALPAAVNASHPQVKNLANAIITAQTKEISEMTQWQTAWGYTSPSSSSKTNNNSMPGMSM